MWFHDRCAPLVGVLLFQAKDVTRKFKLFFYLYSIYILILFMQTCFYGQRRTANIVNGLRKELRALELV